MTINDYEPDFERECILAQKVYNECSITECPTYPIPVPPTQPPVVSIVECNVTDISVEGTILSATEIEVVANFTLSIEYDGNTEPQFIEQTAQFRRRIRLEGALPGMEVVILPFIQCLQCRPVEGGTAIECDVGIYLVIKVVALVQLEVMGRFCPQPPECEIFEPLGCPEWFQMAEEGVFWDRAFPPQPPRNNPRRR